MKLLRFRYIFPVSVFTIFGIAIIAYAAIIFDDDVVGIWYGPNNPGYSDPNMSFSTNRDDYENYACPPLPEPPCTVDCPLPPVEPEPVVIPVVIPPPSTGDQSDSF